MINHENFIKKGNALFERKLKREFHFDQPYSIIDIDYTQQLADDFEKLHKELPEITNPQTVEEVLISELKRVCRHTIDELNEDLSPSIPTPEQVIDRYSITTEDMDLLKAWMKENIEAVKQANKNQFEFHSKTRKTSIENGSPHVREKSEGLVLEHIDLMKTILKEHFFEFPGVKELLEEYLITVDSINRRSQASRIAKAAFIGGGACCYACNGKIELALEIFLELFGHEVFGHCLNFIVTENAELPLFIKENQYRSTSATRESISDYFEHRIFEYAAQNESITQLLSTTEPFDEVYKRYLDTRILRKYYRNFDKIGIWILSTTKMGEHDLQIKMLQEYSIDPSRPSWFVNAHRNNWNRATGLLLPRIVSELRYSVDSVGKILKDINKTDEDTVKKVERLLLSGFWTTAGVKDWVRVNLQAS